MNKRFLGLNAEAVGQQAVARIQVGAVQNQNPAVVNLEDLHNNAGLYILE